MWARAGGERLSYFLEHHYTLIGTQIKGTAGVGQSEAEKREPGTSTRNGAFQKLETLRMIIPGLFGYRLDMYTTSTNPGLLLGQGGGRPAHGGTGKQRSGGAQQRRRGQPIACPPSSSPDSIHHGRQRHGPQESIVDQVKSMATATAAHRQRRIHGRAGLFAGPFRTGQRGAQRGSPYSTDERRAVWFWGVAALFSLLAAWGRYGFLYALIYHLPLIANFRNPHEVHAPAEHQPDHLVRLRPGGAWPPISGGDGRTGESFFRQISTWWKRVSAFEKWWAAGCAVARGRAVAGYFILDSSKPALVKYLLHSGFDATTAPQIANFCVGEVGWFIIYLAVSVVVVVCILAGAFSGRRAVWAWVFLASL
jgi:hypothetical protein